MSDAPLAATLLKTDAMNPRFRSHLRFVEPADSEFVYGLRRDPQLTEFLSTVPPDVQAQHDWICAYKLREAAGTDFYFVIHSDGRDVGLVRIYDFRTIGGLRSFSWGSWIIRPPRIPGLATFTAAMMYELGFDTMRFERAHFQVTTSNTRVVDFHLRAGASIETSGDDEIEFCFTPSAWETFRENSRTQIQSHRVIA